jgi:hypothetical protein
MPCPARLGVAQIPKRSWAAVYREREAARRCFAKNLPQLSESLAEQSYGALINPKGFAADGALSIEGVRRVLALRSRYGEPKRVLIDPLLYYDPQYYEAAKR